MQDMASCLSAACQLAGNPPVAPHPPWEAMGPAAPQHGPGPTPCYGTLQPHVYMHHMHATQCQLPVIYLSADRQPPCTSTSTMGSHGSSCTTTWSWTHPMAWHLPSPCAHAPHACMQHRASCLSAACQLPGNTNPPYIPTSTMGSHGSSCTTAWSWTHPMSVHPPSPCSAHAPHEWNTGPAACQLPVSCHASPSQCTSTSTMGSHGSSCTTVWYRTHTMPLHPQSPCSHAPHA
jgi:hypothetical protein